MRNESAVVAGAMEMRSDELSSGESRRIAPAAERVRWTRWLELDGVIVADRGDLARSIAAAVAT